MNASINPDFSALRDKLEMQGKEISELRGSINQLDKTVSSIRGQSVWQLIALIVTLSGSIVGSLAYQTHVIEKRLELVEKHFNIRIDAVEKRIEMSEKNLIARFEDLTEEVRALRK